MYYDLWRDSYHHEISIDHARPTGRKFVRFLYITKIIKQVYFFNNDFTFENYRYRPFQNRFLFMIIFNYDNSKSPDENHYRVEKLLSIEWRLVLLFFSPRIRFYSSFLKIQPLIPRLEFVFTSYPGENSERSAAAFRWSSSTVN